MTSKPDKPDIPEQERIVETWRSVADSMRGIGDEQHQKAEERRSLGLEVMEMIFQSGKKSTEAVPEIDSEGTGDKSKIIDSGEVPGIEDK